MRRLWPRSISFSVSILGLMALIVVPLASALLWLGWLTTDSLEQRRADERTAALTRAVSSFLTDGVRIIMAAGQTLGAQPSFAPESGATGQAESLADDERRRQLVGLLGRHPAVAAVYAGYADGHFLYAGRPTYFSAGKRAELGVPEGALAALRAVEGEGAARRETWSFVLSDGTMVAGPTLASDFDPRTRPWFEETIRRQGPALTDLYRFAWSNEPGLSAGIPMAAGGVLGFDFRLGTLARLIGEYRITPGSVVMVSAGASDVLIESEPCQEPAPACSPQDREVRQALREVVAQASRSDWHLDRSATVDGRAYRLIVRPVPPVLGRGFAVATAVPVDELFAASRGLLERTAILAVATVALAIGAALAASLLLSRAIGRIATKTEQIRGLDFSNRVPVKSSITEIRRLSDSVERMREGLEVFGRYVSKNLVHQVMRSTHSAEVGGVRRDVTVMFTDIEGFSRLSENIEPELLTSRLSRYFEALGGAISGNHGMIDKYIGDSVMAFWNAPELDPDHVVHACRAALQASAASRQLGDKWRGLGRPAFRTRIGLHTGPAVVGNVGARERINYTLVGQVANQASRLEGLNKAYGTEILASGEVAAIAVDHFVWRHVDRVVAAGTTEALDIYEPLGEASAAAGHGEFLEQWRAARDAYAAGRFDAAITAFSATLALRPGDGPSRTFIERCNRLLESGMPPGWEGVWHFDQK